MSAIKSLVLVFLNRLFRNALLEWTFWTSLRTPSEEQQCALNVAYSLVGRWG